MAGRCASKEWACACGNGSSRGCVLQAQRLETLLLPEPANVLGLPNEIGGPFHRWDEVGGNRRLIGVERQGDEILAPLRRGIDHGARHGMQGTLGERRERPDLLDVVSEEFDAKRLAPGARKHVDEPSAHRDLPALIDAFGALVPRECESLYERVEPDLVFCADFDRCRSRILGRKAFGESTRRCADEPPLGEDFERPCPFTDQVRRWLETGAELHAAARKEGDARRIGVPGDGLCCIACLLVFGKEAQESSCEGFMNRCQHERQSWFRDPRGSRKVVRERAKPLAFGESGYESMERRNRLVHTTGGNGVPCPNASRGRLSRSCRAHPDTRVTTTTPRGTPVSLRTR